MTENAAHSHPSSRWLVILVLGLAFALMVSSGVRKSATVDEQSHLFRGAAYLRTGATHFLLGHPLLGGALSALPLLSEPELSLPQESSAWSAGDWSVAASDFLWRSNDHPLRIIFLGRLPVIWLTLLLGAGVYRWGRTWMGGRGGLLAAAWLLLDPNVIAHGRFITGDLPVTLFLVISLYGYWCWATVGQRRRYLFLSGLGLGLAAATKFNAVLIPVILIGWGGWLSWQRRSFRPMVALLPVALIGWVMVWLFYGFSLWHGWLPGGAFWDDLLWQWQYAGAETHGTYLFGAASTTGRWAYFPVALAVKTPMLTLALLASALVFTWRRRDGNMLLYLWFPAAAYFVASIFSALNIGYRYLIPMMPLLLLAAATMVVRSRLAHFWHIFLLIPALLAIWIWPDYVPFFNVLAGGNGWRILSDSNVDWGQDLPALARWQEEIDEPLYLSYFGTASPSAYGVDFVPLPTWMPAPEQGDPRRQLFRPGSPAPGLYAVSVTNLHGVVLGGQREVFADLRQPPLAKIGGSIFVYSVEANGPQTNVAFSGLTPADVEDALFARLGSNDLQVRWFDAANSLVWPADGGWLVVAGDQAPPMQLAPFWPAAKIATASGQTLIRLSAQPPWFRLAAGSKYGPWILLQPPEVTIDGNQVILVSTWEVHAASDRPMQIFVHALDGAGEIVAQWDGLDVDPGSLQVGDRFAQVHAFTLPDTGLPHSLSLGVYDAVSGARSGSPLSIIVGE